ncbi:MAG: sulfatase-like hydrolase/transferase [Planctomycetota bacterium]
MSDERPNILLIITDHHAWFDHFGPGRMEISFPNWEKFCAEGVRFEQAFAVCPLCSPARASMMTGLYPSAHRMIRNTDSSGMGNVQDLAPGTRLYGHWLREAGYRNAYVGKWHCGAEKLPEDYGIEGWSLPHYGKPYMSDRYRDYCAERGLGEARARIEGNLNHPEWEGQTLTLHDESPWKFMNGSGVLEGPEEGHEENFVAGMAVEKLRELSGGSEPWSLVASFWGPHQPYYPSEPYAGRVDPSSIPVYPTFDDDLAGRPLRHVFHRDLVHCAPRRQWTGWADWQPVLARAYEQQLQLDAAIGRILAGLEESSAAENTLALWVADHGDALASHGGVFDKSCTMTEEVVRVPMAARWPGETAAGRLCSRPVSNMDVTATMLAAAGLEVPGHMHSRSLLPVCRDPEGAEWQESLVCEHHGHGDVTPMRMLVDAKYKYVAALDEDELYDRAEDPHETRNLIDSPEHAPVAREMRARLAAHIEEFDSSREGRKLLYALRRSGV